MFSCRYTCAHFVIWEVVHMPYSYGGGLLVFMIRFWVICLVLLSKCDNDWRLCCWIFVSESTFLSCAKMRVYDISIPFKNPGNGVNNLCCILMLKDARYLRASCSTPVPSPLHATIVACVVWHECRILRSNRQCMDWCEGIFNDQKDLMLASW